MSATAFVGLGAMGLPMATNLAAAISNQPLIIYNRSRAKSDTLASAAPPGAVKAAATLQEVAGAASIVHLMLADDSACDAVITELLKGSQGGGDGAHLAAGSVIVNHSTVHPGCSKRAAAAAEEAGVEYVAAPVFGRPDAAAARKLLVVPAGPPAVLRRVAAHLEALGRVLPPVGEDASKANVLKLTGNFMIAGAIEMISEALAVSEKHGVPGDSILGFIEAFFPAPPIVGYARRIVHSELDAGTGFTVDLALKDVRYMRQLAEEARAPLPLADLAFGHLLTASAIGHGSSDWGAISLAVRTEAGLPVPAAAAKGAGGGDKGEGPKE